jgi:hypothetical protein
VDILEAIEKRANEKLAMIRMKPVAPIGILEKLTNPRLGLKSIERTIHGKLYGVPSNLEHLDLWGGLASTYGTLLDRMPDIAGRSIPRLSTAERKAIAKIVGGE